MSAEVLGRRQRAALAGRSLSSPSGRANPVPGRARHPSLDAIPDGSGPERGQQLGQGLNDSGKGWMGRCVSDSKAVGKWSTVHQVALHPDISPQETCSPQPPWTGIC